MTIQEKADIVRRGAMSHCFAGLGTSVEAEIKFLNRCHEQDGNAPVHLHLMACYLWKQTTFSPLVFPSGIIFGSAVTETDQSSNYY